MKNFLRTACLVVLLCWSSSPGRNQLYGEGPGLMPAMPGTSGLPAGPGCPLPPGEPPALRVPVLTTPDPPAPCVSLKVRVPACVAPGQPLEYRIFVENCSPLPAHHVIVRNALPANARFLRASPEPHRSDPELQWHLGTMQGKASCEITLLLIPLDRDDVANCTRIQYEHGQCTTTRIASAAPGTPGMPYVYPLPEKGKEPGIGEPGQKKGPFTKEPPQVSAARLKLDVAVAEKVNINQPAHYAIKVTNLGPTAATNVLVDSLLPVKLTVDKNSTDGVFIERTVAWLLGNLEPGASRTVEFDARAKEPGQHCVRTRVLADRGISAETETCTTFVGVLAPPSALLLEMYDREDPIALGSNTSYPIWVLNQGTVPVTNLRIQADLPDGMDLARARGPVDHKSQGKSLLFEPVTTLEPGTRVEFEVYTRALAVGDLRFRIQLTADQLKVGGPVHEEESTIVYDEDIPPARVQQTNGRKKARVIPLDTQD